ncbi:hypothetical protein SAMN04515618_111108 [Collimonas sp. OK307]|nr:hypothetical protein SAMN04515618_111108 [Collimonas sp. OK307]
MPHKKMSSHSGGDLAVKLKTVVFISKGQALKDTSTYPGVVMNGYALSHQGIQSGFISSLISSSI